MMSTHPSPIILVPSLVPSLRCPDRRCRQPVEYMRSEERFRGALKCTRSSCRTRWFAEPIDPGDVRHQLETAYLDPQIAIDMMVRLRLPETIELPMYLQIPITLELWSGYASDTTSQPRSRTIRLVRGALDALHRRAS